MINADVARICQFSRDNQKVTCILEEEEKLNMTGYKVLQNQEKNGFIKGVKTNYNGKIKLVYDVTGLESILSIVKNGNMQAAVIILSNLVDILNKLKENGFIQCENVSLDINDIFVDKNQYKVHVIYIPIKTDTDTNNIFQFEHELKELILKLLEEYERQDNNCLWKIREDLQNGSVLLENLKERLHDIDYHATSPKMLADTSEEPVKKEKRGLFSKFSDSRKKKEKKEKRDSKLENSESEPIFYTSDMGGATELLEDFMEYCLLGMKTPEKIMLKIDSLEYTIGKSEEADGVIGFNKAISRIHCKITQKNGKYFIEDLKSLNGTFLNGKKLVPNKPETINAEDKIKLANSDFVFRKV